jgi:uncharacterized protein (DUF2235 family)
MPKNIVLLLDGTSNEIETNRTNILRLYGTLEKSKDQLVYYDPGVGTLGDQGTLSKLKKWWSKFRGMAFGTGLEENVLEAYRLLVDNFEVVRNKKGEIVDQDRIFIFGYSRGAQTARVLAGFIHAFGLLDERNLNLLTFAYRAYKRINEKDSKSFDEIELFKKVLRPTRIPVQFLGLFDTVSSVFVRPFLIPKAKTFAFTQCNPSVCSVRHAVALEERRTYFRPDLWEPASFVELTSDTKKERKQDVKEVWFSGFHSDVGGGNPEACSALAKIPLKWMISETEPLGLSYLPSVVSSVVEGQGKYEEADPLADANDSMSLVWSGVEFAPRKKPVASSRSSLFGFTLPLFEWRHVPSGALIHKSVKTRGEHFGTMPPNLPKDYTIEG